MSEADAASTDAICKQLFMLLEAFPRFKDQVVDVMAAADGAEGSEGYAQNYAETQEQQKPLPRGALVLRGALKMLQTVAMITRNSKATTTGERFKPLAGKSKWAPVPLATVEFQKRVSRWLRISSDAAMTIAEKLYQQGILSYPRTETDQFQDTIDLGALVNVQTSNPNGQIAQYASQLQQPNRMRRPRDGGHDAKAHPPIHPTKPPPANLSGNDLKVYDFVARHFLACVSHDAQGEMSQVILQIASEKFRAYGSMVKQRNYLDIYPWEKWANNTIPTFNVGQVVVPASLELAKSSTQPLGLLTEADLIAMMDRQGIGTDATIATHIETMLKRGYATKDGSQQFHPTDLGRALLDGYDKIQHLTTDLTDPQMRAEMEMDMNRISRGEKTRTEVVDEQRRILGGVFRQCQNGKDALHQAVFAQLGAKPQELGQRRGELRRRSR